MKPFLLWYFHFSHWPNRLCHLGDDKCKEVAREVNYNVFVISSNTRCAGTQCLQLHDILPLPLRQEGIHNDGRPHCIWCIHGHSCTGSHFLAYVQVKVEFRMNLSSRWPTTVLLQLLLCPYQLIVACCNLFSCNGAVVLCMCWHVTIIMAIAVIMIIKWHWHLDALNGITTLIVALGVTLGICSCVTRTTQISGCTRLVPEVLCTSKHQLCIERDVMAALLPHKANLWYKGWLLWWLWSQTWLSSCGTLGFQDWWQSMSTRFVT